MIFSPNRPRIYSCKWERTPHGVPLPVLSFSANEHPSNRRKTGRTEAACPLPPPQPLASRPVHGVGSGRHAGRNQSPSSPLRRPASPSVRLLWQPPSRPVWSVGSRGELEGEANRERRGREEMGEGVRCGSVGGAASTRTAQQAQGAAASISRRTQRGYGCAVRKITRSRKR
jgi:hypothetical protein